SARRTTRRLTSTAHLRGSRARGSKRAETVSGSGNVRTAPLRARVIISGVGVPLTDRTTAGDRRWIYGSRLTTHDYVLTLRPPDADPNPGFPGQHRRQPARGAGHRQDHPREVRGRQIRRPGPGHRLDAAGALPRADPHAPRRGAGLL